MRPAPVRHQASPVRREERSPRRAPTGSPTSIAGCVLDFRLYRAAFLPALGALIIAMFSLESRPEPVLSQLAPDSFDARRAAATVREIMQASPEREPGSAGDHAVAGFVAERFGAVGAGRVSVQRFDGRYGGRDAELQNVVLVLPGQSDRRVVVMAHRDATSPAESVGSAAATAALIEMAGNFGGARHRKTLVLVSSAGGAAGAAGARRFAERFPRGGEVEAAVVLDQPAARDIQPPMLVPWSAGPQSTSIQLVQSAKTAIRQEVGRDPGTEGILGHFLRLALPFAWHEQGALIAGGIDAVTLTSTGSGPPPVGEAGDEWLSVERLGQFGRATLSLALAIDASVQPLQHGPDAYVPVAGNLLPGWSLALLGIAFLLPAAFVAVDGVARARRRRQPVLRWIGWVGLAAAPFATALAVVYLLSLIGWIPRPVFPYHPARVPLDASAAMALATLAAIIVLGLLLVRPFAAAHRRGLAGEGAVAALSLVLCATVLAAWVVNPYLALLLVPAAHLWLLAVLPGLRVALWMQAAAIVAGLALPLLAFAYAADRLGVGWEMTWHALLMTTGGHIGLWPALLACLFAGSFVAALAIARAGSASRDEDDPDITVRGPITYAGPGSLGGTESALPRQR